MEGDEPVEIELTPTDSRHNTADRSRPAKHDDVSRGTTSEPDAADPVGSRWTDEYSQRSVITIVCVGIAALGFGWLLGRAAGDDPDEIAASSETTTPSPDTSAAVRGETLAPVETVAITTEPAPRPTTTVALIESETIDVDPAFAGSPYELVGLDQSGALVQLDMTTGELETRRDLGRETTGGTGFMWAGNGWVIVPDWNNGTTTLVEDDADPVRLEIGLPWQILESETSGEFWIVDERVQSGFPGSAQRVDRYGEAIGDPIDLDQSPRFADPTGGLVVEVAGRTYRVDADGATKIADGTVLAVDAERVIARTCDDQLRCRYDLIDRSTGESVPAPVDAATRQFDFWPGSDTNRIAPDGRTIAITGFDVASGPSLELVDIETGQVTELSRSGEPSLRWSPDGRFVFYSETGVLMAHELATGESFDVADELPPLNSFAVRPNAGN